MNVEARDFFYHVRLDQVDRAGDGIQERRERGVRGRRNQHRPRTETRFTQQPLDDEPALGNECSVCPQEIGVPHPVVQREARVVSISYANRRQCTS